MIVFIKIADNGLPGCTTVVVTPSSKKLIKVEQKKRLNERAILRFLDPVIDRNIDKLIKTLLHSLIL